MNNLPLFYFPAMCTWVDDDETFLKVMSSAYSNLVTIQAFSSVSDCRKFLDSYQSPIPEASLITSNKDDENFGLLKHAPVDLDITEIIDISNNPKRYEELALMIMDYNMPEENGFQLAKKYEKLLTGKADQEQILEGFNNGLINKFILKGSSTMDDDLERFITLLLMEYFSDKTRSLLTHLEAEAKLPQSDSAFSEFFIDFCQQQNISEYYLIDKQGSMLCKKPDGSKSYFIIQTEEGLNKWLELYGDSKQLSPEDRLKLEKHTHLPFFGVGTEAWQNHDEQWQQYIYSIKTFQGKQKYYWTLINDDN